MNDDDTIKHVKKQLTEWALGDVKAASEKAKMGGFILGSCLIDYLGCFYVGADATGETYKEFVGRYMPDYNSSDLYSAMRCKLVHNYTEGGIFAFTDNKAAFHFKRASNGQILLNLENFIADIEKGMNNYFSDLEIDKGLRKNMIKRFKKVGILGIKRLGASL